MNNNYKYLKDEINNITDCKCISSFLNIGHFIGEIEDYISEKIYDEDNNLIHINLNKRFEIQDNFPEKYNIVNYTNEVPLILDSIKKYFYLGKNNYILVTIKGVKYIINKNYNQISIKDYISLNDSKNIEHLIRKIFAFNWIMCVKNGMCLSYEKNILVKSLNPLVTRVNECSTSLILYTIGESGYISDISKDVISTTILNKWFDGKIEIFYKVARNLLEGIDIDFFRNRFVEIINFYNKDYIGWSNSVYERLRFIKGVY